MKRFGIAIGDCEFQAILETTAILIAVRLWSGWLASGKLGVVVRSDSESAIGALVSLSSPVVSVNAVVREIALDLAEGLYRLDLLEHIPGALNVTADALSRVAEPGQIFRLPPCLKTALRREPERRGPAFWLTGDEEEAGLCGADKTRTWKRCR